MGREIVWVSRVLGGQTRDRANVRRMVLGQAVSGRVWRQVGRLGGVMTAVRLERRVWAVLLDQASLAWVLELGRRETLLVRIGVVLKKRSVSGWRLRQGDCWCNGRAWMFIVE
jgi:hypothetical protein